MSLVRSKVAHANILSIDASDALKMEGVFGFISAEDVPWKKPFGVSEDQQVFIQNRVS